MIFIPIVIVALLVGAALVLKHADRFDSVFGREVRRAGWNGEQAASDLIDRALRAGDCLLTNVAVEFEGKPTELDNVIINKFGVFIIEVKNYSGVLSGGVDDYEWKKYKTTHAGNTYVKDVKNPIKQVKRQTYILAHYFEKHGIRVWVRGYAILVNNNSPFKSGFVLESVEDIARAIHTPARRTLDSASIMKLIELLPK